MRTIITTIVLFFICVSFSQAQLTGSATVCSGYIYSYSANITGAVTYTWSFPAGWYGITGQGTANASATCNAAAGSITVEGFNGVGTSVGTLTLNTQFGSGGAGGWDVQPAAIGGCSSTPFSVSIVPNGTGNASGCPGGCGNGVQHANIHYALYNNVWPFGQFIVFADGISTAIIGMNVGIAYVYKVDVTNGYSPPQAVQITGGCGSGTVNNVCTIGVYPPLYPSFMQLPVAPCIGDTIQLFETTGLVNPCWGCLNGLTGLNVIGSVWTNPLTAIVTNSNPTSDVTGIDANGCLSYSSFNPNVGVCAISTLTGDSIVCVANRYTYTATIAGAVSYNWTFPTGWYNVAGQGSSSVSVTCNKSTGAICVQGFNASGNAVGTVCLNTQFGGGTPVGWDVQPQNTISCSGDPINLTIVPNASGSGSCPNSCGNGVPVTLVDYGVYDNVWPLGNFVGFANGSSISVPPNPGSYTYYIYYVDYTTGTSTSQAIRIEGGCGTATSNSIVQLTVPTPAGPGFIQTPDPVCIGDTVTVWAGGVSGSGSLSPIMGLSVLSTSANSITAIVSSIPARAQFSGLDIYGCPVSEICYINAYSCNSILTGDSVVCNAITYSYSISLPGAVTFDWLFPVGWYNVTGQGTSTASATCDGSNGWVSVTGQDALGNIIGWEQLFCQAGSAAYCASTPITAFQSSDTTFCDKQSINFNDLSTNTPTSWQWSFTGANPASSTDQHPQNIYYPTVGSFTVSLKTCNTAGCDSLTKNNFIVEYQSPFDSIYQSNDTLYSTPAATYQWYEVDSGLIIGATNYYYVPVQAGNYYCSIINAGTCVGVSNVISITTGINQVAPSNWQLTIVPNPNTGNFQIDFTSTLKIENIKIQIVNVLGEIVFAKNIENRNGKFSQQINLLNQPKGVYYLIILSDEKLFTKKIIVQ